jgi:hypothetical protein
MTTTTHKQSDNPQGKQGKQLPQEIKDALDNLLNNHDGNLTAKELAADILADKKFDKYRKYSDRTFGRYKKDWIADRNRQSFSYLDEFWSVGQLDDKIPPYEIGTLMSIQKLLVSAGDKNQLTEQITHQLTKRRSLLIARIHQALDPALRIYSNPEEYYLALLQIASFYTAEDQKADRRPKPIKKSTDKSADKPTKKTQPPVKTYADTFKSLDMQFLINQDASFKAILYKWVDMFFPHVRGVLGHNKIIYKKEPALSNFISYLLADKIDDAIDEVDKLHPELRVLALRYMALNTRDELVDFSRYEIIKSKKHS